MSLIKKINERLTLLPYQMWFYLKNADLGYWSWYNVHHDDLAYRALSEGVGLSPSLIVDRRPCFVQNVLLTNPSNLLKNPILYRHF